MIKIEKSPVYLLMVTSNNNNKYYKMIPNGDIFTVEYGRVGTSCQHASYPISQWNKKYKEKISKGYVDQTHLVQDLIQKEESKNQTIYKSIENKAIADIVQRLQDMAHKTVQSNYKISSNQVTQAMVDEAQNIINELSKKNAVKEFNETLLRLFSVIPRKMKNVNDYIAHNKSDFTAIIKNEQDLLDVMRGQVITHTVYNDNDNSDIKQIKQETILDAMGLVFEEVSDKDIRVIKSLLGDCRNKFYAAWKVTNIKTQKRFDDFVNTEKISNTKLLWHGSRNENWWSIINTGLVLRPTNAVITGKMFGYGIYYAPKARKSLGYTSLDGSYWTRGKSDSAFMALMEVAYGKPYDIYSFDSKYYNFNYEKLKTNCKGANCLHAHAGQMLKNDEIVIYKEEQCTIKYLVEIKNK